MTRTSKPNEDDAATRSKKLKRTGINTSVLACGTSNFLVEPLVTIDQAKEVYNYALDAGIDMIVTNTAYKVAEESLYSVIGQRRDEYSLSVGTDYRTARLAEKDIDKSLKTFHTDYIDIYQMVGIRRFDAVNRILRPDGALNALLKAKKEGKIGHIGIAGHSIDALVKAMENEDIECCQFVFNMVQRQSQLEKLIPAAQEHDIDLFVMRPLEHGWYDREAYKALRFVYSSPVDVVISGMYSKEMVDASIAIAEAEATKEEWRRLLAEAMTIPESECKGCMMCRGHWVDRDGMACPRKIDIYHLLIVRPFRKMYGLSPEKEKKYRDLAAKIKNCNECMGCENVCIFNVPVVEILHKIENELQ